MNILLLKSTKTIPLKIIDADFDLVATMKKYANGMNEIFIVILDNGRIIPARTLQPLVYAYLRENIGLKFQVSCNIPRQVVGTYKIIVEFAKIGINH